MTAIHFFRKACVFLAIFYLVGMIAVVIIGLIQGILGRNRVISRKSAGEPNEKILGREICLALFCSVIPAGSLGLSHFVFNYSGNGKIISILLGFLFAGLMLALRIWRMEKKNT